MLEATERTEAEGGLLTADGVRNRTPGGVFLFLARGRLTAAGMTEPEWHNFISMSRGRGPAKKPASAATSLPAGPESKGGGAAPGGSGSDGAEPSSPLPMKYTRL